MKLLVAIALALTVSAVHAKTPSKPPSGGLVEGRKPMEEHTTKGLDNSKTKIQRESGRRVQGGTVRR